jgi:hypothetical protein
LLASINSRVVGNLPERRHAVKVSAATGRVFVVLMTKKARDFGVGGSMDECPLLAGGQL